jgi:segregation and condensation protein A
MREARRSVQVPHEVRLDVFSGPIDLLLHLITRRRVDIYEVSLAEITDE